MSVKEMKKEDLELLSYKDITNLILGENGAMSTKDLFLIITEKLELPKSTFENKIADYYTMLTTDKRFLLLEDARWDLSKHHTSDKVVVSIEDEEEIEEDVELMDDEKQNDEESEEENYDIDSTDEDEFDDSDDDLKDLVILDEDELGMDE